MPLHEHVHVTVEYFDGQAEGDVGYPYYVAACDEIAAVTDGRTLDELLKNIHTLISAHLEDADPAEFNLIPQPGIILRLELADYAQIA